MLLLYAIIYLIVGIVTILALSVVHMVRAITRGYSIETIATVHMKMNSDFISSCNKSSVIAKYVWGILIWPIRAVQFIIDEEKYMSMYKHYEETES